MLPENRIFRVFCDESGQTGCRFMTFGGVVVQPKCLDSITAALQRVKEKHATFGEFKWGKVSRAKLSAYLDFVNVLAAMQQQIHYKALIIDAEQVDWGKHHEGDKELGFYKFYWHLLYHKFQNYVQTNADALLITLDQKESPYSLSELKRILNRKYASTRGLYNPVRAVEAANSKESVLIQLVDILTGAIGFHCNQYDKAPRASAHRIELAKHIAKIANVGRLCEETRWSQSHFEIWPMKFRK